MAKKEKETIVKDLLTGRSFFFFFPKVDAASKSILFLYIRRIVFGRVR